MKLVRPKHHYEAQRLRKKKWTHLAIAIYFNASDSTIRTWLKNDVEFLKEREHQRRKRAIQQGRNPDNTKPIKKQSVVARKNW